MGELERRLKRNVRAHLRQLGFTVTRDGKIKPPDVSTKDTIRQLHGRHRTERLKSERQWIRSKSSELLGHFANSEEVLVDKIRPVIEEVVTGKDTGDLFRFASLLWSVPVSKGYGRRLRFLVRDDANGKLIGLIG